MISSQGSMTTHKKSYDEHLTNKNTSNSRCQEVNISERNLLRYDYCFHKLLLRWQRLLSTHNI